MAYAMNYDVYKSMDALEAAVGLDETHFFAQMKYAELLYRLRALERAEEETAQGRRIWRATGGNCRWRRKQLQDIRQRRREGTQKPTWNKPLRTPALALLALTAVLVHGDGDMEMNWKYFGGACLVVGAALLKAGAPPAAIAAGIGLAGIGKVPAAPREAARVPAPRWQEHDNFLR